MWPPYNVLYMYELWAEAHIPGNLEAAATKRLNNWNQIVAIWNRVVWPTKKFLKFSGNIVRSFGQIQFTKFEKYIKRISAPTSGSRNWTVGASNRVSSIQVAEPDEPAVAERVAKRLCLLYLQVSQLEVQSNKGDKRLQITLVRVLKGTPA